MRPISRQWLLIIATSLTLGSITSFSEKFITTSLDILLPESSKVDEFSRPGTITFLSTQGKIIQKIGPATREKIAIENLPIKIKQAFISSEDRRFYNHKGIDSWGILRALITNIQERKIKEGASTITQQLARTVFLNQDKTLTRKFKEALLAYKLERQLSKDEILEKYLNAVYLGSGAYGVADAAWVYFSKTVNELTLDEAALIAGLAPAPSYYSPLINPKSALKRRAIVLKRMLQEGLISFREYSLSVNKPLELRPARPKFLRSKAPFFTSWLQQKLPEVLTKEQLELGGIKVKTSLNLNWQDKAKEILQEVKPSKLEGALVSIEPTTGLVRVMIGGKNFYENEFNRATQALRSPGSTFKIFPYLAAINKGFKPESFFIDKPTCWESYCPKNFGNKYMGKVTLEDSLTYSLNTVAVKLIDEVGFKEVILIANKLGVGNKQRLGQYYPLAIGAYEQTVLDMTAAYAAINNEGVYIEPIPFEEIRGPGNILIWSRTRDYPQFTNATSKSNAAVMTRMLQKAVEKGTGFAAKLKDRPVAGKTGTSEGGRDLWFIGSVPELTTSVWLGYDDNRKTKKGSGEAAWIWKQFINTIKDNLTVIQF